jgi:hypothetical protein
MIPKVIALVILLGLSLYAAAPPAITGDYVEVRSHHVYTCGCLYSGEQATAGREAIVAWAIRQGQFDGVSLDGVRVAAVVLGQANLGLKDTARKSVVFVDGVTSTAQRQATVALLREQYGAVLGDILDIRSAPISLQREGERLTVSVGEMSRVVVRPARLPQDAHLGSSLWYEPFIPTTSSTLMTTEHNQFSGPDFHHQWRLDEPGITGYTATFAITR